MELYQLIQFKAIAETGNMTQAAEKLCVSQPALSMTLKKLEAEFGVRIFDRQKKNIVLNDAGKLLLKHTELILEKVEDAQEAMAQFSKRENTFVVGFVESSPMWFFQSKWMSERDPHSLQCSIVPQKEKKIIENHILNGTFDAIVTIEPVTNSQLCCKHLIDDIELLAVPHSSELAKRTSVSVKNDKIPQMALYRIDNHFYHAHMNYYNSLSPKPEIISFPSLPLLLQYSNESDVPILASMLSVPHHPEFKERKVLVMEDEELLMRYYIVYKKSAKIKSLTDYFFKRADEAADFLAI